jgi:heme-degrading monooxygenase HmoA
VAVISQRQQLIDPAQLDVLGVVLAGLNRFFGHAGTGANDATILDPRPPAPNCPTQTPMYSATFIFAKKQFDAAFHTLDQQIAAIAKGLPGYLGEETWENPQTGLVSNVYYWESLEALQQLVEHPRHREAKAAQGNWLAGYQVIISQVIRTYGDSRLAGVLPVTAIG